MGIVNRELEIGIAIGVNARIHVSVSVGISDAAECTLNSIYPRLDAAARADARADADVFFPWTRVRRVMLAVVMALWVVPDVLGRQ
jgi:hypothetical protein